MSQDSLIGLAGDRPWTAALRPAAKRAWRRQGADVGIEVVALVVDDDEGREVLDLDLQTASMPSSGYSSTSTLRMLSSASRAAGPPIEPR